MAEEVLDYSRPSHPKGTTKPKGKGGQTAAAKRPTSPSKAIFKKPIFRRSQSNEDARKLHKTQNSDDGEGKPRALGNTLKFLGNPRTFKNSLRTRDVTIESLNSNLASKASIDPLQSGKHLDNENTDRTRGKGGRSSKSSSKGEKFWRQVLKFEASRVSNHSDANRPSTFFGFDKVGKGKQSKPYLERSVTELGRAAGEYGINSSTVIDTTRDKRHLSFGRTNLTNLQPFLKIKAKAVSISVSRWEDLDLLKKAGKKLSLEVSECSLEGNQPPTVV
jgi:hypothetical protein